MASLLEGRRCAWCRRELPTTRGRFCSQRCRQTAFRLRRRRQTAENAAHPMRIAYADPPYPGTSAKYYKNEPSYAGEVDHAALIASLGAFDGWALSTSAKALRDVLPLCPESARVAAWVKPHGASVRTYGLHNCWEPVIVVSARNLRPGTRDWLSAHAARGGGALPGRKPIAFCAWLFELLGMQVGDELTDLFPGTGVVSASWRELSSRPGAGDASLAAAGDASFTAARDSHADVVHRRKNGTSVARRPATAATYEERLRARQLLIPGT